MEELLEDVALRSARYLADVRERGVAPSPAAIARLAELREAFPAGPSEPADVLALLDDIGSAATVGSAGAWLFGFVCGGSLPAARAAHWRGAAWDQIAAFEVATAVRKVVTPFSSSMLAQAAGLAALRADDEMRRRAAIVVAERERLLDGVRKLYPEAPESQGNFVWLPLRDRTTEVAAALERSGIYTRAFAGDGIRVTVGTPDENDAFLSALT